MAPISSEGGRFLAPADPNQLPAPNRIDCGGDYVDRDAKPWSRKYLGLEKMDCGFAKDGNRGDDDKRALQHGGKILGLMMTEGMIGIWRLRAHADGEIGGAGHNHVDDALQSIRQKRDRPCEPV